jgi:lipid A 3-O-deacylase
MKIIVLLFLVTSFMANTSVLSAEKGRSLLDKLFNRELPGEAASKTAKIASEQVKTKTNKDFFNNNDNSQNISVYTGTFDTLDKEGDDQTTLFGVEHKNKNLFRDTWLGRFSPTTGAFFTKKNSVYLYTGIEVDYNLGPINISPSFAPGYYEAGDGKNLGSALEFKSEIKIGVDLFKNTNLGYSYSHISNNEWGDVNPGTDNQSITFSKKF